MFGSQALETVVGLVFFFLAISIFVTSVQEFLTTLLGLRSSNLKTGLQELVVQEGQLGDMGEKFLRHSNIDLGLKKSYVSATDFTSALVNTLTNNKPDATFDDVSKAIGNLPDGPLKRAATAAAVSAKNDLAAFEKQLATWFDNSMESLSGAYKRFSGYLSLGLGAFLAFAFNLDAICVAKALWASEALRQQATAVAAAQIANNKLASVNLSSDATLAIFDFHFNLYPDSWVFSGLALFGCAVTAFAVSLGAPFWFDILQNVMNLRGTGAKPARADAS